MKEIRITLYVTVDTDGWVQDNNIEAGQVPTDVLEYVAGLIEGSYAGTNGFITKVATSR